MLFQKKALVTPLEEIKPEDADVLGEIVDAEKNIEVDENETLRAELDGIFEKGLTPEMLQSTNIQKFLDSDAFSNSEKETINYIFDYAKDQQGREDVNSYLADRAKRFGQVSTRIGEISGIREGIEGQKEYRIRQEQVEQERLKTIREVFGEEAYQEAITDSKPAAATPFKTKCFNPYSVGCYFRRA